MCTHWIHVASLERANTLGPNSFGCYLFCFVFVFAIYKQPPELPPPDDAFHSFDSRFVSFLVLLLFVCYSCWMVNYWYTFYLQLLLLLSMMMLFLLIAGLFVYVLCVLYWIDWFISCTGKWPQSNRRDPTPRRRWESGSYRRTDEAAVLYHGHRHHQQYRSQNRLPDPRSRQTNRHPGEWNP